MLLGWKAQKVLGLLHPDWPGVIKKEKAKCNQVKEKQEEKPKKKKENEFPVDKKYEKIKTLLEHLEDTDRLLSGDLDLKLKPGAEPYLTNRVQRINYHEMDGCIHALKAQLD